MSTLSFLLTTILHSANALPVRDDTAKTNWGDEPESRGTMGVLFSCAAALALCVWTGVHLNVDLVELQGKKVETVSTALGKVTWALIALVAPDLVLVIALHQFLVAFEYRNFVNKKSTEPKNAYGQEVKGASGENMKLKMAFFALMGGFSVEVKTVNGRQAKSITKISELTDVMMMDRIHDFPLAEVDDKSNASGVAKIVACFQAGWILLQCFGRQLDNIYITLLELNTAIHVTLAIIMYFLWWKKPSDVSNPIVIARLGTDLDKMESTVQVNFIGQTLEKVENMFGKALGLQFDSVEGPVAPGDLASIMEEKNSKEIRPINTRKSSNTPGIRLVSTVEPDTQSTAKNLEIIPIGLSKKRTDANLNDTSKRFDEAVMVMVFCRAIRVVPQEASERTSSITQDIRRYFDTVVKRDVADALLQNNRQMGMRLPLAAANAAYAAAYTAAHQTAFKIAHRNIYTAVFQLSHDRVSGVKDGEQKKWGQLFDRACIATRKVTFSTSLKASFAAMNKINAMRKSRSVLETELDDKKTGPGFDRNAVIPTAAINAARAATRSASRQAVRLAAMQVVLGNETSAKAAASSFDHKIREIYFNSPPVYTWKKIELKAEFDEAVKKAANAVNGAVDKMFREHFREAVGSKVGSDVEATVRLEKQAICVGIFDAVFSLVKEHLKDDDRSKDSDEITSAYRWAFNELKKIDELDPEILANVGSHRERLKHTLYSAGDVVWNQLIHVPGLFQPARVTDGVDQRPIGSNSESPEKSSSLKTQTTTLSNSSEGQQNQSLEFAGGHWVWWHRTILFCSTTAMGVFYGGIHATRLNDGSFPTHIEALLWQIACSVGAALIIPVTLLAYFPFMKLRHQLQHEYTITNALKQGLVGANSPEVEARMGTPGPVKQDAHNEFSTGGTAPILTAKEVWDGDLRPQAIAYLILCGVVWVIFLSARGYLLIESVISLRSLPKDAFSTVKWADVIPHV